MELLILAHFQEASEFRNFVSLVDQELLVFFFFRGTEWIWLLNKFVYSDHSGHSDGFFESVIQINGKKEGFRASWHSNGEKWSEGSYRDGEEEGFWVRWNDNGKKWSEGSYRNGEPEGHWTHWYDNGEKRSEGSFKNGKQEGLWTYWYDHDKRKYYKTFYQDGIIIRNEM